MTGGARSEIIRDVETPIAPTEERRSRLGPRNEGEEICHLVEWDTPDTALCGKDVTGWPWNPPWPLCVICVDLAQGLPGWGDVLGPRG